MKRIISFIGLLLVATFIFAPKCFAASSIKVTTNKQTVIVGNTFNVTVTVSGTEAIGSWQYTITYDSTIVRLESGKSNIVDYGNGSKKSASYSYTFKALKTGSTNIGVKSYDILGWTSESTMKPTANAVTIRTLTQAELEATYSKNADLKALSVDGYEITPGFNKDTLEYSLEVANDVENINISAAKADATASIAGAGAKTLVEGNNKFEIVVTAQKGNTKTYVINIERKELDPIYVDINKTTYSLVRKSGNLPELTSYTPTTVTISDTEIPALYSEITKYTIVGVKDSEGNVSTYIYNDGKYTKYVETQTNGVKVYIRNGNKAVIPDGYKQCEITINGEKVNAYRLSKDSKRYLIYGVNVENGEEGLFVYDSELNSIVTYDDEYVNKLNDKSEKLLYVSLLFIALFVIIFVTFMIYIIKTTKKLKRIVKKDNKKKENKKKEENILKEKE